MTILERPAVALAMPMQHADVQPGQIHTPFNWLFASDSARLAETGFAPGDVNKVAVDLDTGEQWRVSAVDGSGVPSWQRLGYPASNVVTTPAGVAEQDLLVRSGGTWARLAVGTAHRQMVVKSDGTLGYVDTLSANVQAWGALPTSSSATQRTAIRNAIDFLNAANGGILDFPGRGSTYTIDRCLFDYARVSFRGSGGRGATVLKADAAGDFSDAPVNIAAGDRPGLFMVKWNGGDQWAHGVRHTGIRFDTSGIAGLGAMWHQQPGENSWFDDLRCDACAALPRTVTDAQITNASNVVTFTASTVTEDDWGAYVTDRTDGDHTLAGPTIPALTRIDRINWANPVAFPPQRTATSITLSAPASAGAANSSFTIKRPTDAFVFEGNGAATGAIGRWNGINNSGALLRIKGPSATAGNQSTQGTWDIESLAGDGNVNGLARFTRQSCSDDPMSVTIRQIKVEPGTLATGQDPAIMLDRCGMVSFTIYGGSVIAGASGGRDVMRIDQPQGPGPSVTFHGGEGANPFNAAYTNIIRCPDTGEVVLAGSTSGAPTTVNGVVTGQRYYPAIYWGRDIVLAGGAKIAKYQAHRRAMQLWATPDVLYNASTWTRSYASTSIGTFQTFNGTNAQNDGAAWQVDLSAGVWKLTLVYSKAANQAIVTLDFSTDGGATFTSIGTVDEYNASAVGAAVADFTNITVPVDGPVLVRARALTRNASDTTGWVLALSGMEWSRTA